MSKRPLSLNEFKNWLTSQDDMTNFFNLDKEAEENPNDRFVGCTARSKVAEQKLISRMETDDDAEILAKEFFEEGGTILIAEDKRVQIQTESGVFYIPRFCVKIRSND